MKTLESLDNLANGNDTLENLNLLEFAYCSKVRELYQAYRTNRLSLDECKRRKSKIEEEFKGFMSELSKQSEVYALHQDGIKQSDVLRCEVNKTDDVGGKLEKCLRIVSLLTGDETFYTSNVKCLED